MLRSSARRVALAALKTWRIEKLFADSIISRLFAETELAPRDRAFALELFYGVLRNLTLLDFWIRSLRPAPVDVDVRDVLRLGLCQLLLLETPQHAAVYESVELAKPKQRSLINGVLRMASRRIVELHKMAEVQPLEIRTSHPAFLIARWRNHYGAEAAKVLCVWNNQPPPLYARINQLKISRQDFLRAYPEARPSQGNGNFVEFGALPSEALGRGHCYIQDSSTAIACELLDPKAGEKILDACAAPGGKTSYLAQMMQNRGTILACDRDPKRVKVLEENLTRLGAEIVRIIQCDWTRDDDADKIASLASFDRVLVDAPCSNTGVIRRRVDVRWRLKPVDFKRMQKHQIAIVRAVLPMLKRGGVLVYSTCSLEPEENEEVAQCFATDVSALRLQQERRTLPFRDHFDGTFAAKFVKRS